MRERRILLELFIGESTLLEDVAELLASSPAILEVNVLLSKLEDLSDARKSCSQTRPVSCTL